MNPDGTDAPVKVKLLKNVRVRKFGCNDEQDDL